MSENFLSLALEMAFISGLAVAYYLWKRKQILYGPRNWRLKKLHELFSLGLNEPEAEKYPDLEDFLSDTQLLVSKDEVMTDAYISRWRRSQKLPTDISEILNDCAQWAGLSPNL